MQCTLILCVLQGDKLILKKPDLQKFFFSEVVAAFPEITQQTKLDKVMLHFYISRKEQLEGVRAAPSVVNAISAELRAAASTESDTVSAFDLGFFLCLFGLRLVITHSQSRIILLGVK